MLASDLTLDKADGTDQIFRLVSQDGSGSRRLDIASTLALPSVLNIKHSVSGKEPSIVDRHLVSFSKTLPSTVGSVTATVNFTLTVPRDVAVTSAVIWDMVCSMLDLLSDGSVASYTAHNNVDSLLRGEA
jgi:hypothetical protein